MSSGSILQTYSACKPGNCNVLHVYAMGSRSPLKKTQPYIFHTEHSEGIRAASTSSYSLQIAQPLVEMPILHM